MAPCRNTTTQTNKQKNVYLPEIYDNNKNTNQATNDQKKQTAKRLTA